MTTEPDKLIKEAYRINLDSEFNIIKGSPDPFFVEFLRKDVSKGATLLQICGQIGVDISQVAAFGDGDNDKEMLDLVGLGVAMKNAKSAAKEVADVIIDVIILLLCTY